MLSKGSTLEQVIDQLEEVANGLTSEIVALHLILAESGLIDEKSFNSNRSRAVHLVDQNWQKTKDELRDEL